MEPVDPRKEFRLLDAMILTAATSVGMGILGQMNPGGVPGLYVMVCELVKAARDQGWPFRAGTWLSYEFGVLLEHLGLLSVSWLFSWSIAIALIKRKSAGLSSLRVPVQPGMMASLAVLLTTCLVSLPQMVVWLISASGVSMFFDDFSIEQVIYLAAPVGGLAVVVSWMTMLLSGGWQAESNWLDRLGRVVGMTWCMASLAMWSGECLRQSNELCQFGGRIASSTTAAILGEKIYSVANSFVPWLAFGTLALLTFGLFRSRSQLRARLSQPGMMAAFTTTLAILWFALPLFVCVTSGSYGWVNLHYWLSTAEMASLTLRAAMVAILVSWFTLFMTRRWKAEATWFDRLGLVFGGAWMVAFLAMSVAYVLCQVEG